ncbi:hypothetical protein GQ473_07380 [archaeon]|nr:hypothetical protein [archaeon]
MTTDKTYGSVWFSLMSGETIGIVTINNGYEDKAYIGIAKCTHRNANILDIIRNGTPFPFDQAIEITGGK